MSIVAQIGWPVQRSRWMLFLVISLPLAVLGLILVFPECYFGTIALPLFQVTVIARLALHFVHRVRDRRPMFADLWLLPARDLLICWVWCRSFFTSRFTWRGSDFHVGEDGIMRKVA